MFTICNSFLVVLVEDVVYSIDDCSYAIFIGRLGIVYLLVAVFHQMHCALILHGKPVTFCFKRHRK